jgi:hypothetical protein
MVPLQLNGIYCNIEPYATKTVRELHSSGPGCLNVPLRYGLDGAAPMIFFTLRIVYARSHPHRISKPFTPTRCNRSFSLIWPLTGSKMAFRRAY